jgi:hypothetical protein
MSLLVHNARSKQVVCDSAVQNSKWWLDPIELDYPMMDFDDYEELSEDER